MYAAVFSRNYGITTAALRYFNVFGPRQDPNGGYAAVIPKWITAALNGEPCQINGDGSNTRDFCHVENVVEANILAATGAFSGSEIFNVGMGKRTSLKELAAMISEQIRRLNPESEMNAPIHAPARSGDILHSLADITKIRRDLGFEPSGNLPDNLHALAASFTEKMQRATPARQAR